MSRDPAVGDDDPFEDLPHALQALGTLGFEDEDLAREWARVLRWMGVKNMNACVPTSKVRLRDWIVERRTWTISRGKARSMVASGVALADLVSLDRVATDGPYGANFVAEDIAHNVLSGMADEFPDMTLAAAIGWALICPQVEDGDPVEEAASWVEAGLGEDGWLYVAAGLSPDETVAGLADGSVTPEGVRLLVALRGILLPA